MKIKVYEKPNVDEIEVVINCKSKNEQVVEITNALTYLNKSLSNGFVVNPLPSLEISSAYQYHFTRKKQNGYHSGVFYRGILEVNDQDKFKNAFFNGIGCAKSFGFGLLLIAPKK